MLKRLPVRRWGTLLGFLSSFCIVCFSFYAQYYLKLHPCPLCVLQRLLFAILMVIFLIAFFRVTNYRQYAGYSFVSSLLGMCIAGRHVWLQSLPPDTVPACGPNLYYALQHLPWRRIVDLIFLGDGHCAIVTWRLLGQSMAMWSLLCFFGFLLLSTIIFCDVNEPTA